MAEPSLVQIFGDNAIQSASTITISKADLPGLTPSANNSAESLIVGIILKAMQHLTQSNFDSNFDQSITILIPDFNAQSLVLRNNQQYRQHTISINLHKIDNNASY